MKLELERQEFLKAWQIAERFVDTKTSNESLKGILMTAHEDNTVTLEATDLKTSVRCNANGVNVTEPGFAVLPAGIVGAMLRKADHEILSLEVNSARGFLKAGNNKTRCTVLQSENFPKLPESINAEEIFTLKAGRLAKIISEGGSSASLPQDFPKYMGTCLLRTDTNNNSIKCASTDGRRLSLSMISPVDEGEKILKDNDLLLPAAALKELAKMTEASYSDKEVKILAEESTVWFSLEGIEFSIRRIEAAFPNYERILNSELKTKLVINSSDLLNAIERVDIIAKATPAHIMAMALHPNGEVRITARAPERGTTSEVISGKIEGEYLQLGFNVGYFQDGLKALGPCEISIEFSSDEGQTRMRRVENSEDFLYMLMPARLSAQDSIPEEEMMDFANTDFNAPQPQPQPEQEQGQEPAPENNNQENNY